MEGTTLAGRYRIARRLGRGGFGTVYEAEHLELGSRVAIKVLDHARASHDAIARFLREAQALTRLTHAAAVKVFDRGQTDDGAPWIAMELLAGETLDVRLQRGVLFPGELVALFRPLCELLTEAHEKGIVHRDLKPSNVMLLPVAGGGWSPKLFDFGIATLRDDDAVTGPDVVGGTPRYMAPEQWLGLGQAGAAADVYSLGMIAYECLSGRLPFAAEGALAWMNKHRYEAPLDLRDAMAGRPLPEGMRAAIMRAVRKAPEERPPTPLALWHELSAGLEAAVRGDDDTAPPARARVIARRTVLRWGVPVVLASGAGAFAWWRHSRADRAAACPPLPGSYMPLTVGSWWRYRVLDPHTRRDLGDKTIALDREALVDGASGTQREVRLARVDGQGSAERWLARIGDAVVWLHDEWFDKQGVRTRTVSYQPFRLRVDDACAHRRVGARWVYEYDCVETDPSQPGKVKTTHSHDTWSIDDDDDEVEVPAGRFRALKLRLRRIDDEGELDAVYWFAAGVGKVKEVSTNKELEDLIDFHVVPG